MEPRPNELKTTQPNPEALAQRPESRQRSRFSIEPLEERISPCKGGHGCSTGGTDGGGSYGL
jgi:hypothetical protein